MYLFNCKDPLSVTVDEAISRHEFNDPSPAKQKAPTEELATEIDMRFLHKQRLKSLIELKILGGDLCPPKSVCPVFSECGGLLQKVSYCNIPEINDEERITYVPPKTLSEHDVSDIDFIRQSPSYSGQLISLSGGSFVNLLGLSFIPQVNFYRPCFHF
jgi:hypothetical protein